MFWKIIKWIAPILILLMGILFSLIATPSKDEQSQSIQPNSSSSSAGSAMRF